MVLREFNRLAGRLQASAKLHPLYPIKPVPLSKADSPKIIYDSIKTKAVTVDQVVGTASYSTLPPRLVAKMKKYQADVTKPVFLINGTPDKILFGTTVFLTFIGLGMCVDFYWPLIWTK
ncbi:uncharacterized protein LOC103573625 [Microplitis demolitor]|uniref:uncharacterized protein LOC103573625 n=1 Tax=Microplitis demolitor TaxID=69319 RepID=UPI0004CD2541|nr:uncharacterized protein LOC103573625 [Microplitis demolitor]